MLNKGAGKGRALTLTQGAKAPEPAAAQEVEPPADRIPIVGNVAAGSPILAQECIEDYLTLTPADGRASILPCASGGVHAQRGHSARRLRGGAPAAHGLQRRDRGGAAGDEATVKRLSRRNGQVWLLPENENYQPIDGREATLLGKVTAVIRQYS